MVWIDCTKEVKFVIVVTVMPHTESIYMINQHHSLILLHIVNNNGRNNWAKEWCENSLAYRKKAPQQMVTLYSVYILVCLSWQSSQIDMQMEFHTLHTLQFNYISIRVGYRLGKKQTFTFCQCHKMFKTDES